MSQSNDPTYVHSSDEELLRESVGEKCHLMFACPGMMVEFDPEEAAMLGAFRETALSEKQVRASASDEYPYGKDKA